jgi:hypothetical protein
MLSAAHGLPSFAAFSIMIQEAVAWPPASVQMVPFACFGALPIVRSCSYAPKGGYAL